jgi:protease-4
MTELSRVSRREADRSRRDRSSTSRLGRTLLLAAALLLGATPAAAQNVQQGAVRLPATGRSIVTNDDTTALVSNPATLGFLPGEELRWTSSYLQEAAEVPWQGHSIALGFPIDWLSMATGLRVDLVNPPASVPAPLLDAYNYHWLTWGLAFHSGRVGALGASVQRSFSTANEWNGLASWSFGFASRPYDTFGMGFVAHHMNAPRNLGRGAARGGFVERSYDFGIALRPLASRVVELGLEARYVDQQGGFWVPRAVLGIDVPWVGRLRGDFSVSDPSEDVWSDLSNEAWAASLALAIFLNTPTGSTEFAGGTSLGSQFGQGVEYRAERNVRTEIAFKHWREPVGPTVPRYAVRLRLEETPGEREHVRLLQQLWRLADDSTLDVVLLELRAKPASSFAHAQELRDAIGHLRRNGRRVMCHLEDAGGAALYTCAAANRILMNPAGGLRFAGLKSQSFYYASLLRKLGIRADFVRIGPHKSAPESFQRDSGSPVARRDKTDLLQQVERQVVSGIAAGRGLSVEQVRARIAKGPFVAAEAKAAGFVDGFAFDDQLEEKVIELAGRRVLLVDEPVATAPAQFGTGRGIALVYASGNLIDGTSKAFPLLDVSLLGSYSMAKTLKEVRENPQVAAVVLRIDSPGGSAMAADVVWREVQLTARVKPVVVSMGSVAASGGYYIAAPATQVFASPLSLTGSIGIYYGKADIAELLKKIGVNVEVYKTAPRADAESIFRPFTPDERRELKRKVRQFYGTFVSRVALGRNLKTQQVDKVGQGRLWTGEQAQARNLVDELGGLRQALESARQAAKLPDYAPIVELPVPESSLLGRLLGVEGMRAQAVPQTLPPQLAQMLSSLAPFVVYPADQPLALMELTYIDP